MEKVKITQEQADAIEDVLESKRVDDVIDLQADRSRPWRHEWSALNDFKISKLARTLYIGYEVEPEFNLGDVLFNMHTNKVFRAQRGDLDSINISINKKQLRHATKQEIWWFENDREVDQYKENDVIKESHNQAIREVSHVKDNIVYMKCGGGFGKNALKIICFAEDRKDIDRPPRVRVRKRRLPGI